MQYLYFCFINFFIRPKHIATSSKPKSRSRLKKSCSTPTSKDLNKCYRRSYVKISKLNLGDHVSQLKDLRDSLCGDEKKPKRRRIKQLLRSIKSKSSKNEVGSENSSSSAIIGSKTKNRYRPGPKSKQSSKTNDEKKFQDEAHCIGQSAENDNDFGPSRNSKYPNPDDHGDNLNRSLSSLGVSQLFLVFSCQSGSLGNFFLLMLLALFWLGGYQIDTCLPFSLFLRHGFRSKSEQPDWNRVNIN